MITPPPAELIALSSEFGALVDRGRASECAQLFASDARLIFAAETATPNVLEGLESIRAFLTKRQSLTHVTTRHLATNFRVAEQTADQVTLESLLTVFRSDTAGREPAISAVCDIRETFTRNPQGQWQIQQRSTAVIFAPDPS